MPRQCSPLYLLAGCRPAGPVGPSLLLAAGPEPCPEGAAVVPGEREGPGAPLFPAGCLRSQVQSRSQERSVGQPRCSALGPAPTRNKLRGKDGDRARRPPPGCKLKVNPAVPRFPQPRVALLRGPDASPSPHFCRRQRAERESGVTTYLPQPDAPPGAKPKRRPQHLHGDIRSKAGALSGARARRRPACCRGLGGG